MSWMSTLAKKTKTPRKTKNNNLLKTKRMLNIKMSAKGGAVFTFSLPGGGGSLPCPRQLRHCISWKCTASNSH